MRADAGCLLLQKKKRKAESSGTASDSDAEEMDEDESEEADVAQAGPATEASQERAARPDAVRYLLATKASTVWSSNWRLSVTGLSNCYC